MLNWFVYVLAAVVTWALAAIVDKIFLTKFLNPFSYFFLFTPPKLVLIVWIMLTFPLSLNFYFWVSFAAGILGVLGYYTYAFAVQREEISRVYSLVSTYPFFVAVLAAILIGEVFVLKSYIGILLTVLGTILISYKKGKLHKFIPLIVIALTLGSSVSYGVEQTISKISLNFQDIWQFLAAYMIGNVLTIMPALVIPQFRNNLNQIQKLNKFKILTIESASALWIIGVILFFYSASLGPITLVSTVSITTPFFVFLFTIMLSKWWPKILVEELETKTVGLKLLAIALLVLGIYFIS